MNEYSDFQEQVVIVIGLSFLVTGLVLAYLVSWIYMFRNSLPHSDELTKSERIIQPRLTVAISAVIILFGQMVFCSVLGPPNLYVFGIALIVTGVLIFMALYGMWKQNLAYYPSRDPEKRLRFERFWIVCGLVVFGIFVTLLLFLIWALVF